jgi:hypothetical protein
MKSWRKRFFVLEMGRLTYFEKPSGKDASPYGVSQKGCMVLTNVQLQESDQESERNSDVLNQIYLVNEDSGKDLLLSAADYQDAQRWKEALQAHILFATVHSDMAYTDRDTDAEEKSKMRRASALLISSDIRPSSLDRLSGEKEASDLPPLVPQIIGSAEKITVKPTAGFVIKTRRESGTKVSPPPLVVSSSLCLRYLSTSVTMRRFLSPTKRRATRSGRSWCWAGPFARQSTRRRSRVWCWTSW